ncbi:MAG: hypothetical protein E6K06_00760, partial [Methanobacteriota archaeon]
MEPNPGAHGEQGGREHDRKEEAWIREEAGQLGADEEDRERPAQGEDRDRELPQLGPAEADPRFRAVWIHVDRRRRILRIRAPHRCPHGACVFRIVLALPRPASSFGPPSPEVLHTLPSSARVALWRSMIDALEATAPVRPPSVLIPWPFERVRAGQADFLADARRALADGRHLLAHAPTGIGKTAVALVASLEVALRANKLVLFLTSRQSHHRIAIETVRRIEAKGPRIATVDLIAKQSMCLQENAPTFGRAFHEFCDLKVKSRTCTYFTRDNSAVVAAVLQRTLHVQELVRASGACRVCPHKVAMDAAARANLVVCDYNYVFSEILERFLPRLGRGLDDLILVVDEAHNLPDRIRAHLGGDLSVQDLLKAAKEARSIDGEVSHQLAAVAKAVERYLLVLRSERIARKDEFLDLVEDGLRKGRGGSLGYTDFVEMVAFAGEDAVRRGVPSSLPSVAEFLAQWRDRDEGILRLVLPGADGKFAFRLMDPSVLSKRVFGQVHASVLMSGTLFPAEMYADLLGIERARRVIRTYGSPFPRSNRLLLVHPFVTTTYAKRSAEMHGLIAGEITGIASGVRGNVAAF